MKSPMILSFIGVILSISLGIQIALYNPHAKQWYVESINDACLVPIYEDNFYLCDDVIYDVDGFQLVIPSTFITDLASIPRLFWSVYSPFDYQYISPAILHDYLYVCHKGLDRATIDDIFYYSLLSAGSSKISAYLFWIGVRLFGEHEFIEGENCYGDNFGKKESKKIELAEIKV
jgi:hypothetical protein